MTTDRVARAVALAAAFERVREARSNVTAAEAEMHEAIVAARELGLTLAEIAEAAELSNQRISQITRG